MYTIKEIMKNRDNKIEDPGFIMNASIKSNYGVIKLIKLVRSIIED